MSGIVLSAGVRQNLLALQNTSVLQSVTQGRLATGKKVNSALDNPSNFFTSQALDARAGDLNSLLDSIGQAQKTLEAADKGLTSLTKLVQSAKATATQALQATKGTVNYNLSITGTGAIGSDVAASETGASAIAADIAATLTGTGATIANDAQAQGTGTVNGLTGATTLQAAGLSNGQTLTVTTDTGAYTYTIVDNTTETVQDVLNGITGGGVAVTATLSAGAIRLTSSNYLDTITVSGTGASTAGFGVGNTTFTPTNLLTQGFTGTTTLQVGSNAVTTITFDSSNTFRKSQLAGVLGGLAGGTASIDGSGNLTVTATSNADNIVIGGTAGNATRFGTANGTYEPTNAGLAARFGQTLTVQVGSGSAQTITFGSGTSNVSNRRDLAAALDAFADITASINGSNQLVIGNQNSGDTTSNIVLTGSALGLLNVLGFGSTTDTTYTIMPTNATLAGLVSSNATFTMQVGSSQTQTITFGTGGGQIRNKAGLSAALAAAAATSPGVTATVNGSNFVDIISTSASSITLGGSNATLTALGFAAGTYAPTATVITPAATRTSLQTDYNNLLTQIDALARDSSYNGINLLNGNDLKVVFNENGTSSLTISGVIFDSAGLGLTQATGNAFQDDNVVTTTLSSLDATLATLRTQSSKFGSNVTVVQTRQDFTKQLITTLQTGADALVLADTNEEGANMLALQTRQQLSTTALSLSAQADQAVLRLFG